MNFVPINSPNLLYFICSCVKLYTCGSRIFGAKMDKTKNHRLLKFSILIHISNLKFKKFLAKILEYKFIKDFRRYLLSYIYKLYYETVLLRRKISALKGAYPFMMDIFVFRSFDNSGRSF